jgi:LacI family purine nucleotide synthesis repressor
MLEGKFERPAAYREMRKYLREGNPLPDAIFAANDLSAIGCISAITEMGYSIPEDVSIIGCDDITLCEYINPPLTTIRTQFQQIGTEAAQEVLRLIQGEPGRLMMKEGILVVRKSCAINAGNK